MRRIKVSAKMARLKFNGCEPEYIRNVCHARCCDAPGRPSGILVTIHHSEQHAIEARGGSVSLGLLQPRPGERRCCFKGGDNLCQLHHTPDKPFGCIASPFTLNHNATLIVRNRYRLLICYKDGRKLSAYKVWRGSLDLLFGADESGRICDHLDDGGGDFDAFMADEIYAKLMDNDATKKAVMQPADTKRTRGRPDAR